MFMRFFTALPATLPAALAAACAPAASRLLKAPVAGSMVSSPRARRLMRVWAMPGLALARAAGMAYNHKHWLRSLGMVVCLVLACLWDPIGYPAYTNSKRQHADESSQRSVTLKHPLADNLSKLVVSLYRLEDKV